MQETIENLLTKIQAEFLALDFKHIDAAIVSAQRQLCEFFGTDRSSLWQGTEKDPHTLLLTHLCSLVEIPPVPEDIKANEFVPWVTEQLLQKKTVVIHDVDKLPKEASVDKENLQFFGDKSTLVIPFVAGFNPPIYGALSFTASKRNISWGNELISQCELIAQVFSSAIARKNAIALLNTERFALIKAKEEAEKNEIKFRTTLEFLPIPIGVASKNGKVIFFNKIFTETFGYTVEDVPSLDKWFNTAYPDEAYRKFVINDWTNFSGLTKDEISKTPFRENNITCKNGEVKIVELSLFQTNEMMICVFTDVTEKRRKDEEYRKSQEIFSTITNLSPDIVSVISKDGDLLFNSQASLRIHGYTQEDLVGKNTIEFIHPEDRERVISKLSELNTKRGNYAEVQYRYLNKDGSYVWMEATALNELENPLLEGIIVISRDISLRKSMEDNLKDALSIRDEFISIASHELKTPMTSLKLQLQLLTRQISKEAVFDTEKALKGLSVSNRQVDRITSLVENLLDVARINTKEMELNVEEFNLSELLEVCLENFHGLLADAKCPVTLNIQKNIIVGLDKNRIDQIFENLISNAIKYAPGKLIEISLSQLGTIVRFVIKDHGMGIPEEKQKNIFEKYERVLGATNISGLGLGLFITKQIVEAHNGTINVLSEKGDGATFILELPVYHRKS